MASRRGWRSATTTASASSPPIHRGTEGGGMVTRIGNDVLLMNYVHVAHDCHLGDHSIIANSTETRRPLRARGMGRDGRDVRDPSVQPRSARMRSWPPARKSRRTCRPTRWSPAIARGWSASIVRTGTSGASVPRRSRPSKSAFRTLFYGKLLRDEAISKVRAELWRDSRSAPACSTSSRNSQRGVVGRDRE